MPTALPIYGVIAPTGVMLRVRVRNPDGSTNVEFALAEESAGLGIYAGSVSLIPVDDTSGVPYTAEVREVTAQTSGAFDASTTVRAARQPVGWNRTDGAFISSLDSSVNVVAVNYGPATLDTGGGSGGAGTGTGDFPIDENGGSGVTVDGVAATAGCMRFTSGGVGVDNVQVIAYTEADYIAGLRGALERRGTTYTNSDGDWVSDLMLDAGETYIIQASIRGYLAKTHRVVIP